MRAPISFTIFAVASTWSVPVSATDRYVSAEGGHVPPFTSWAEAATNIQDTIDASLAGDTVWVTNGVFNVGGRFASGQTNRIVISNGVTVRSINGPAETVIEGYQVPGITNGSAAIRCAFIDSYAVLSGFTLRGGATMADGSGGGAMGGITQMRFLQIALSPAMPPELAEEQLGWWFARALSPTTSRTRQVLEGAGFRLALYTTPSSLGTRLPQVVG